MRGRLNIFQRTMIQWDALHPYNAIHVVKIPVAFDAARLRDVLAATLQTLGLTGLGMDRRGGRFEYRGGAAACELTVIAAGEQALAEEVARQLNQPFAPAESFSPFRFFVAPEDGCFRLGLVYFHAVADAESIVRLLRAIVRAYAEGDVAAGGALERHPPPPPSLLLRQPGLFLRKLLALPALIRDMKKSFRPDCRDEDDLTSGFVFFALTPEQLRGLIAAGKSWGVTVNDLFLAVLLKGFASLAVTRSPTEQRLNLSVGCIVNTRKDHGIDSARTFGLYLGSFVVTHAVPAAMPLRGLAEDVHRITERVKRDRIYLAASVEMALASVVLACFSPARRKNVYRKNYPLWGGITNLNLNPLWPSSEAPSPLDYFRAVSTGPVTPVVLSATTVGGAVNLGVSYRTSFFMAAEIEQLKKVFLEQVEQISSGA